MFDVQQTIKDLEDSITYLREHSWIQGRNFDRWGGCCAWGAVLMATDDVTKYSMGEQVRSANLGRAFYRTEHEDLMRFNDEPGRTKDEVIAALQRTLDALKAKPSILTAKREDDHEQA